MRVAVSGSHGVGKSTLIAAFLRLHPEYVHEPEAFEVLGDDIVLTEQGVPTPEALQSLLEYTVAALAELSSRPRVVFERSPVDYLAYAAAIGRHWQPGEKQTFLAAQIPIVRASITRLDLVAYVPFSPGGPGRRRREDERFRRRVDLWMRRIVLDDVCELWVDGQPPRVIALPPAPDRQLDTLSRLARKDA